MNLLPSHGPIPGVPPEEIAPGVWEHHYQPLATEPRFSCIYVWSVRPDLLDPQDVYPEGGLVDYGWGGYGWSRETAIRVAALARKGGWHLPGRAEAAMLREDPNGWMDLPETGHPP